MCTLVLAWRAFDDAPVAVAANRDEAVDRPSEPPRTWDTDPRIVAPRDARDGGTWIGYNEAGLVAGISNLWDDRELVAERSRGLLVLDALGTRSTAAAARAVEDALAAHAHDGFNLVLADGETAVLLEWSGRLAVEAFEPGLHVVMNAGVDDRFRDVEGRRDAARRQARSARTVRDALAPGAAETETAWLDRAAAVLGDHDVGVCVHGDGFGTRSSSLLAVGPDGGGRYRYADGPPCVTSFEPVEGQS